MPSDSAIPRLLSELRETRDRLDSVLRAGALERQRVRASCDVLMGTLRKFGRTLNVDQNFGAPVHRPRAADPRLRELTNRELQVLTLIAEGRSTKEIAFDLKISFKTAVAHRTHLLRKLGAHETATLVRIAVRGGLVSF